MLLFISFCVSAHNARNAKGLQTHHDDMAYLRQNSHSILSSYSCWTTVNEGDERSLNYTNVAGVAKCDVSFRVFALFILVMNFTEVVGNSVLQLSGLCRFPTRTADNVFLRDGNQNHY
jgi:hypothetical protein